MSLTRSSIAALPLLFIARAALAHTGGPVGGFASGFEHPISGWDHVIAMVAVGIWGAFLGKPALWVLPVIFPLVMAFGGALGVIGVPVPMIETGIALSGIVLGLLIAFSVRAPLWVAGLIVGVFAVFHGHAHGTELPSAANPFAFGIGFVIATGLLHLGGIGFGFLIGSKAGRIVVRATGAVIALVGGAFLLGFA
jgi:urease accessory protein